MANHLRRNPAIGVVGPITNNIGNEAKVEVNYGDMLEMEHIARDITTGYRGRFLPIRTVAYFAAMFRRSDFSKFGPLSLDYGRGMFEDDDHCEVIKAQGFVCALAEDAFVHHHLSATFDSEVKREEKAKLFQQNKATFESKWGPWAPHRYRSSRPASSLAKT
jgi:GT2 family glycosyltransferase